MTFRASLCVALSPLALFAGAARSAEPPRFEDFADVQPLTGAPVAPDVDGSPRVHRFRTVLREGAARGPNFAGHFTVVSWGCGTDCQVIAIVDATSGAVVFAPFVSEFGQEFRRESRLLVVNPPAEVGSCASNEATEAISTRYYAWDGKGFKLLAEVPACHG